MLPVRVFRHHPNEGPGFLAEVLAAQGLPLELICVDAGAEVPARWDDVAGLVFMGGPMSANDRLPWIAAELRLIREAVGAGVPVLGHCLGGQLISLALGGRVTRHDAPEIGWFEVERVDSAETSAWRDTVPARFVAFHWHGETFSLPVGAALLLRGAHCTHQGFAIGSTTLGLQCHVEMTTAMVEQWAAGSDAPASATSTVQTPEAMTIDLPRRVATLQDAAARLYAPWVAAVAARRAALAPRY
ncbi:MAG: type 1 glutamine amidotransferase [Proteobacteria bacterium]|nr:type 1 glutamine amidotransferase [Pseudomonadota bacterium]